MEELWLDVGARDKAEAAGIVRIGDAVTLELGIQPLRNQLVNAPGMDDKSGLWVVMEAFRRLAETPLPCGLFAVSTVQEEIGLRGAKTSAFEIAPHVAIANRYMHSPVETVSLADMDHAAELLACFVRDLQPGDDFTP